MKIANLLAGIAIWVGLPISLFASAQNAEWLLTDSDVGVGTGSPETKFHVKVDDSEYKLPFLVENVNAIRFSGFRLQIGTNDFIDFNNSGGNFRINADQLPGAEFEVKPNGNAILRGSLTQNSDVNSKQGFKAVDHQLLLSKVMALPISEWSYIDDPTSRHIGPMAQDFYQSFRLGDTDKGISSIDTGGVALAAIQQIKRESDMRLAEKNLELLSIRKELDRQNIRMRELEASFSQYVCSRTVETQIAYPALVGQY